MFSTEQVVTEYNCTSALRETPRQPAIFVRYYNHITRARIDAHAMAALQDFSYDPTYEFFGDYGSMSRGALCKPLYYGILLIDEVQRNGNLIPVYPESSITALASRGGTDLRLLLDNFVNTPLYEGYERLFWDVHHVNTIDLLNAGYTRWGEVDSTIMGIYEPYGTPEIIAAFEDANQRYEWALMYYNTPRSLDIHFSGLTGTTSGTNCLIDDTHNSNIHKYDSLLAEGYSREEAVSILYSIQGLEYTPTQVTDSVFHYDIPPNGVLLITLQGINTAAESAVPAPQLLDRWSISCPLKNNAAIAVPEGLKRYQFSVYDALERNVIQYYNINARTIIMPYLAAGIYFLKLESGTESKIQKIVIVQ